ncbi:MAG: hypothetical protein US69_C0010G0032 [candidate division TM6 bacterium GW2011_GWF2_38_10]|nr:MAG: hypothetical protein US69_C0010G0032 [candidate division TM6 bacterium GW2011_GWF2_38_10]
MIINKKILAFLLSFFLINPVLQCNTHEQTALANTQAISLVLNKIFLHHIRQCLNDNDTKTQITLTDFLKICLNEASKDVFMTLCHELGHAMAAYLATGKNVDIYLGSLATNNTLWSYKNLHINGFSSSAGLTTYVSPINEARKANNPKLLAQAKIKEAIILLAGGLCAVAGYGLVRKLTPAPREKTDIFILDPLVIHHLCQMLIPFSQAYEYNNGLIRYQKSDGFQLWEKCFDISEDTLCNFEETGPQIEILIQSAALLFKCFYNFN